MRIGRDITRNSSSRLNFTAYLDGADVNMDANQVRSLDSFERVVSKDGSLTGKAMWKRGYLAGSSLPLLPAGLFAAAAGVSGALGSKLGVGVFGGLSLITGLRPMARKLVFGSTQEPIWLGTKSFNLDQDKSIGKVDSTVESRSLKRKVKVAELSDFVKGSFRATPGAEQVVWVEGHGYGHQKVASLKASELAEALDSANKQSGIKPDLLVLNSCLMGNLEALTHLQDSADHIVATEKVISINALDAESFLTSASEKKLEGKALAADFMNVARERNVKAKKAAAETRIRDAFKDWSKFREGAIISVSEHKTLAHFDMEKLPALLNSLGEVGEHFLDNPELGKVARKVKSSMEPIDSLRGYYDLGEFLKLVSEAVPKSDKTLGELLKKSEAFRREFVADFSALEGDSTSSGLTVQLDSGITQFLVQPMATLKTPYRDTPLPESWKNFVQKTF